MQGVRNTSGLPLCFDFLLGLECTEKGCGYHLSAGPPDRMPGTCHADYSSFHSWVLDHSDYLMLSPAAKIHDKLKLP